MKSVKYIGMDVHQATTVVAVLDGEGKLVMETVIATEGAAIIRFLESVSGELRLAFEETTQAAWCMKWSGRMWAKWSSAIRGGTSC